MLLHNLFILSFVSAVFPTRDLISGVLNNLIPSNRKPGGVRNRPKPSYKAPKPSYGAPKPSYKGTNGNNRPKKPKYRNNAPKRKPSYKQNAAPNSGPSTNLNAPVQASYGVAQSVTSGYNTQQAQSSIPGLSSNLNAPVQASYGVAQSASSGYNAQQVQASISNTLTDEQMAALLLSIHSMMQQIVESQPKGSSQEQDSYGTPQGSPLGSSSNSQATQPIASYTGPSSSNVSPQSSSSSSQGSYSVGSIQSSSSGSQASSTNQATYNAPKTSNTSPSLFTLPQSYNAQSINDPVIKSTLEQISRSLAASSSQTKSSNYKPVRFPRNPTVLEILEELQKWKTEKTDDPKDDDKEKGESADLEIPVLKVDSFF